MKTIKISKSDKKITGAIHLDGSKSISNRVLIIRALCGEKFPIRHLSTSKDTQLMEQLLESEEDILDAGAAGTTFRFMTAYLAMKKGTQILTGSQRMKQRPIGLLVDALRKLGAKIEYIEKEGYPPLKINSLKNRNVQNQLTISAGMSSQYISALLLIAPTLPEGLELTLEGKVVSRPYIEMTLNIMQYFGVDSSWENQTIRISPQHYQAKPFTVEADWSAASYYYIMAAFAEEPDLHLIGLHEESLQGDSVLTEIMQNFGIQSRFTKTGIHLYQSGKNLPFNFEYDFIRCPDLAQSLAVVCAGLGIRGIFTGLETLKIKETDRIAALKNELKKTGVTLTALENDKTKGKEFYKIEGKAEISNTPIFPTYEDHRMAMALAPLAMFGEIIIEEPKVVEKSYPEFWEDISELGFIVSHIS